MVNKKRESDRVVLPDLIVPIEIVNDMKKYAKIKGYPMPLFRKRAYAFYLNKLKKEMGEIVKHYPVAG